MQMQGTCCHRKCMSFSYFCCLIIIVFSELKGWQLEGTMAGRSALLVQRTEGRLGKLRLKQDNENLCNSSLSCYYHVYLLCGSHTHNHFMAILDVNIVS